MPRADGLRRGAPFGRPSSVGLAGAILLGAVLLALVMGAMGPIGAPAPHTPAAPDRNAAPTPGRGASAPSLPTPIQHVITVLFENEPLSAVLGSTYLGALAQKYAFGSHYYAACHPSAPNYLALVTGKTWQCGSDGVSTYTTGSIADLLEQRNLSWGGYFESMPSPCDTSDSYPYIAHHNPFVYPADIVHNTSRCDAHDRSFAAWNSDVQNGTIPNYAFLAPNMLDDGHDTGVLGIDTWLAGWLPPLLNTSWFNHSVIFLVFDESSLTDSLGFNGTNGGHVYFVAISPFVRPNSTYSANATHYTLLTTTEWLLGTGSIGALDNWSQFPPMKGLFNFSIASPLALLATANTTEGPAPLSVAFQGVASGGTLPYLFAWNFSDGGSSSLADPVHTFLRPGVYTVSCAVHDALGALRVRNLTVVATNLSGRIAVTLEESTLRGPAPLTANFSVGFTGGSSPYVVSWDFGDGSTARGPTNVSHTFAVPGLYTVRAAVADLLGEVGASVANLTVYVALSARLALNATDVSLGGSVSASVTVSGGTTMGENISWSVNGAAISATGLTAQYTPPAPGRYNFEVIVRDGWGDHANSSAEFAVHRPASSPPGGSGSPPVLGAPLSAWEWALIAAVGAGTAAGVAVWSFDRRSGRPRR